MWFTWVHLGRVISHLKVLKLGPIRKVFCTTWGSISIESSGEDMDIFGSHYSACHRPWFILFYVIILPNRPNKLHLYLVAEKLVKGTCVIIKCIFLSERIFAWTQERTMTHNNSLSPLWRRWYLDFQWRHGWDESNVVKTWSDLDLDRVCSRSSTAPPGSRPPVFSGPPLSWRPLSSSLRWALSLLLALGGHFLHFILLHWSIALFCLYHQLDWKKVRDNFFSPFSFSVSFWGK